MTLIYMSLCMLGIFVLISGNIHLIEDICAVESLYNVTVLPENMGVKWACDEYVDSPITLLDPIRH